MCVVLLRLLQLHSINWQLADKFGCLVFAPIKQTATTIIIYFICIALRLVQHNKRSGVHLLFGGLSVLMLYANNLMSCFCSHDRCTAFQLSSSSSSTTTSYSVIFVALGVKVDLDGSLVRMKWRLMCNVAIAIKIPESRLNKMDFCNYRFRSFILLIIFNKIKATNWFWCMFRLIQHRYLKKKNWLKKFGK